MGHVLQGHSGQAPARQAAIGAGLSTSVEATTVNKVCSSGLKAVTLASQTIELAQSKALVAGGMENMTRVPYYLPRSSQLPAFGNMTVVDGLIGDGLWDVYNQFHMGNCAENTAKKYTITRQEQDDYAIESYRRAQAAYKDGLFVKEIVPVLVKGKKGDTVVSEDEQYKKLRADKVSTLKPVFDRSGSGTITAANSSPLSDGASALVVVSNDTASRYGKDSYLLSKIVGYADAAVDPIDFPIAPAKAVREVLERTGLQKEQIAVWEFNEAFATVIKANQKILGLSSDNVNPRGGAIALGHALGSSGSRILTTLLHQLRDGQYGCAAICNGGGGATAIIVQKIAYGDI
jgi:acetyl-CoA C-acetyltransferase